MASAPASPSRRRRGLFGPLGCLGGLAVVAVGIAVLDTGLNFVLGRVDRWRFPWGYADSGRPALVGPWVGTLVTGSGARLGLLVEIRMAPVTFTGRRGRTRVRRERADKLHGEARVCAPDGTSQVLSLHGDTLDDAAASRFRLSLSVPEGAQTRDGLQPSYLRGRWDGGDAIAFEADVHLRRGAAAITSTDDPDTGRPARAEMHRGGEAEFHALCAALRR